MRTLTALTTLAAALALATGTAAADSAEHAVVVHHTASGRASKANETTAAATAYCPQHTHLTGGGFDGSHGPGFTPVYSRPTADGKGWTAAVSHTGPGAAPVKVTAYAVCESE